MLFTPGLCAAQTCLLAAGKNNAQLGVFKLNSLVLEELENADAHVAAGKVVVCAVNNAAVVYHEVKTDDERNKKKSPKSRLCKRIGGADSGKADSVLYNIDYRKNKIIESAQAADDCVTLKAYAAELVVDGPLPGCVWMAVEDNSPFGFTGTLFDCSNVVAGLFLEERINNLFVGSELKQSKTETDNDKND